MHSSISSESVKNKAPLDCEKQGDPDGPSASGVKKGDATDNSTPEEQWANPPEPDMFNPEAEGMAGVVGRVLSRISSNANRNPGPPPDGGRDAWLACLCAHFVVANTWGFINSFGVFQSYYTTLLDRPPSDVSWIGSIQVWLLFFIGTFTGRLTDAGLFRPVLACGTVFTALGIFSTSFATRYWQLLLSQGLCMGIASGCLFTPAISTVSTYFHARRSLAIGICACGSVTGGLVFPAMARQLLPTVGFGWAVRAIGFVQVAMLLFVNFFMKSRLPPRRTGSFVEWGAFKELEYIFYAVGMFFNFWGVYFGFYYIPSFSREILNPPLSYTESLNLLLLMNGVGIIGRLGPNHLADRIGPINVMVPTCLVTGVALLAWVAVKTSAGLYVWAIFYGIASGGIQSLFPAGLSSLTTDLRKQGTRMGMVFTVVSFSVLTGNPIAGAIIAATDGKYVGAQIFTGVSLMLGTCMIFCGRLARQRRTGAGCMMRM